MKKNNNLAKWAEGMLVTAWFCMGVTAWGQTVTIGGIHYGCNTNSRTAWVSGFSGGLTAAHIQSSVIYSNKICHVTSIAPGAFSGCSGLASVRIPDSVNAIGYEAFRNCSGLAEVTIPDSVTSLGIHAFSGCASLRSVTILGPITDKYESYSTGYSDIYNTPFSDCPKLESAVLGGKMTSIPTNIFDGCTGLAKVTIGNSVTSIGNNAFSHCTNLASVVIPNSVRNIDHGAFGNCRSLTSVTIPDSVTNIGIGAFEDCRNLTSVTLPNGVTDIRYEAFCGCEGLTNVVFGNGVTNIDYGAFRDCRSLTSVTIPDGVKEIGWDVFESCSGLTNVVIGNGVREIAWGAFRDCSNLTSVTIPNSVTNIATNAFRGCKSVKTISTGSGLTTLAGLPIYKNTNLTSIVIGNNVTNIGSFSGCFRLTSVTIPNRVTNIGNEAFSGCSGLANVTIPNGVTDIGSYAFSGCSGLTSVTIPDGVTSIGYATFSGCSGLTSVTIPNSVTSIGTQAFYGCSGLTNVVIPDSVTSIGGNAFYGCSGLTNMMIPNGVTNIGEKTFYNCRNLTNVFFKGAPPNVGKRPFDRVAPGARGYYTAEHAAEWEGVIGANGKWQGLIMARIAPAEFRVASANPAEGSLILAWSDALAGDGVTYSVYRGEGNSCASAVCVTNGLTATTWTDVDYWKAEPVTKPLNYWVVAEGGEFGRSESDPLATRHRYGLCVGYDAYRVDAKPLKQSLADATLCKTLAGKAGFTVNLLQNGQARVKDIRNALSGLAGKAKPGDTVLFYIATHGGVSPSKNNAALIAYDGGYGTTNLASDVAAFNPGVGFIGVIMACRSSAMADPSGLSAGGVEWIPGYSSPASGAANWLLENGLAKCTANVAWVTSCGADEKCPVIAGLDGTQFGEWFLRQGWQNGWADRRLTGVGYEGGNRDGTNTVLELARYAEAFARGRSDARPANVYIQNEALLGKTIVATGVSSKTTTVPGAPTGLQASQGTREWSVGLEWNASAGATAYRVYRGDECIAYQHTGTSFDDTGCPGKATHAYRVRALNAAGLGNASALATGYRLGNASGGTEWEIELLDGTAAIAGAGAAAGTMTVPSSLDGVPVTAIESAAFAGNTGLASVTIPASVTSIGENAFAGCTGLETLFVPESWEGTDMLSDAGVPEGCNIVYGMTYTVQFNANGGTGTMAVQRIKRNAATALPANKFKRNGYVFLGWSKSKTGAVAFANKASVKNLAVAGGSVTLYAQWAKKNYKVAFNANGGQGKMAAQTLTWEKAAKLTKNAFTRKECVFLGWAKSKTGAVAYKNAQAVKNLRTDGKITTLYAKWAKKNYSIAFNANGGKGTMAAQTLTYGKAAKLRKNAFKRSGWTFLGWATKKNGVVAYKNAQTVKNLRADGNTTVLYAVWAKNAYKVAFNANGGSGTMAAQGLTYGKAANLRKNEFKRLGYTFEGWAKTETGAVAYKNAASVKNLRADGGTTTLYAKWKATGTTSTPVAVPHSWLESKATGILAANGGNREAAAKAKAANGINTVWECYVAGLEPEEKGAEFKVATSFENGEWKIAPDPDLNKGGTETNRIYTWEGAETLGDETVWGPTNAASRFFRVKVALPEE